MTNYDIIWNRTRSVWSKRPESAAWFLECILLKRVLIDGKPQMRVICRLAAINEDRTDEAHMRHAFWSSARRKLGKRRLSQRDREEIEHMIAAKVPRPTLASSMHAPSGPSGHPVRGPFQPMRGQALRGR